MTFRTVWTFLTTFLFIVSAFSHVFTASSQSSLHFFWICGIFLRILRDFENKNKNNRMSRRNSSLFYFDVHLVKSGLVKSPYKSGLSQRGAYFKHIFLVEVRHSKQPNLLSRALCASFCSIFWMLENSALKCGTRAKQNWWPCSLVAFLVYLSYFKNLWLLSRLPKVVPMY